MEEAAIKHYIEMKEAFTTVSGDGAYLLETIVEPLKESLSARNGSVAQKLSHSYDMSENNFINRVTQDAE